jgi:hypothetical protein
VAPDQATVGGVAGPANLAVKHCQLVAQDDNLDVLVVWFDTDADRLQDVAYKEDNAR